MMDKLKQSIAASDRSESRWLTTTSLVILAVVALASALAYTRAIMIPFVLALFIVTMVSPVMDFLMLVLRFPRVLAVTITLVVVILIISLVGLLVADVVGKVVDEAVIYSVRLETLILDTYDKSVELREWLQGEEVPEPDEVPGPNPEEKAPQRSQIWELDERGVLIIPDHADRVELSATLTGDPNIAIPPDADDRQLITDPNAPQVAPAETSVSGNLRDYLRVILGQYGQQIQAFLLNAGWAIRDILLSIIFLSIFVIFLLSGRDPRVVRKGIYADIEQKIRRYILTKVAISTVTGLLVWFTLDRLGLPLANVFGILAFLLNFIPSIGSIISTMLPVPIAVAQFQAGQEDMVWLILVILIPGVIQFIIGSLIDPKLMGEGLNLHPVTILLALSFWGLLWGVAGAFLAAPITAAIRIVLMQFDTLKPVGMLLAGKFSSEIEDYRRQPAKAVTETETDPED